MTKPRYRIVEEYGEVHIQERCTIFWIDFWNYIMRYYNDGGPSSDPFNYKTVEAAQANIDRRLAVEELHARKPIITYYP